MNNQQLTLEQIEQLNQVSDPVARRRFYVLFQLPQDLQTAFESEDTTNSLWDITKVKYNLADGDISKVSRIIGLIFLGELPIKGFIAELKNKLNVDIAKAQAIAQDINQAIFQPVRVSLMQVHGISEVQPQPVQNTYQTPPQSQPVNQYQRPQQPSRPPSAQGYGVAKPVKLIPPAYQPSYDDPQKSRPAENGRASPKWAGREEVLNKIRQQPPTPASYYFPRNTRPKPVKKKSNNRYNSFFS